MNNSLHKFREYLWNPDHATRHPQFLVYGARLAFVMARDLIEGQLSLRAMSLVYTTLLSIVPMLALAFSVLKALGAHNALEPVLMQLLAPLGPQAETISASVIGFVENIKVGILGSIGVAFLMYSAVSLVQKVEAAFNFIWRIERTRPFSQRFGEYLSVLTVGPVVVFLAMGATASILNSAVMARIAAIEPFGLLIFLGTRLLPYVLIVGMFTFMYSFVPNTRVRMRAAAWGGLLAGVLWQAASTTFASIGASATNINAVYSSFAILILLLIWLHIGWLILLLGCQLSFYVQHPEYLKPQRTPASLSGRAIEYLALMIMGLVGRRFIAGETAYTQEELSLLLNAEPDHVGKVVDVLLFHGLLVEAGPASTQLVPGIDLDSISLARLWQLCRAGAHHLPNTRVPIAKDVHQLLDHIEADFEQETGRQTLREWLTRDNSTST